jgi:hypothetical protein
MGQSVRVPLRPALSSSLALQLHATIPHLLRLIVHEVTTHNELWRVKIALSHIPR